MVHFLKLSIVVCHQHCDHVDSRLRSGYMVKCEVIIIMVYFLTLTIAVCQQLCEHADSRLR